MTAKQILQKNNINPNKVIFEVTAETALQNVLDCLKEFNIKIDAKKFTKEVLEKLFVEYINCLITYHPDNWHQERATLLALQDELGLTDKDIQKLEFD